MSDPNNPVIGLKHIRDRNHEEITDTHFVMRKMDPGWMKCSREEYDAAMFVKPLPYVVGNHSWYPDDVSRHSVIERVRFLEDRVRTLEARQECYGKKD